MNEFIFEKVGEAALYEGLAEEAAELAKAALKYARVLRGENPTPVSKDDAFASVLEEFSDVICCTKTIGITWVPGMVEEKRERWIKRIKEKK